MWARVVSLASIPLTLLGIWGIVSQIRREQPMRLRTPVIGLVMAPVTLLVNLFFLRAAFPGYIGPALAVFGLGFGLAWDRTARLRIEADRIMGKRSALHLVFWGLSYLATQLLTSFAPVAMVAGGLAAMFFSAGTSLGSNTGLLVRYLRLHRKLLVERAARPTTLPEIGPSASPISLPER
jgi:hypothetical protein